MTTSGIGSVGQSPNQFLHTSPDQTSDSDPDAAVQASATQSQTQIQTALESQPTSHGHHHGGGHHGGLSKLIDTVEQALQSADSSDDPNEVVEDALAKLFSEGTSADGTTATDPDNDVPGSATASNPSANKQSFADFLKSHGVDPQQFRNDLVAAVKDAQNGQVNTANALKSLPVGSSIDVST